MWFGTFYMILQLIPFLSMFFLLTSAVSSALWSVHIEQEQLHRRVLRADDDEAAEEYTDEADPLVR